MLFNSSPSNASFMSRVWNGFQSYVLCVSVAIAPFAVLYLYMAYIRHLVLKLGGWTDIASGCLFIFFFVFFLRGLSFGTRK